MKPRRAGPAAVQDAARVAVAFQQAVALHQQGRPFQADALCAEVLRTDPRHHGAWHLRGLLALENGNVEEGIQSLERSLRLNPSQPAVHSNLGNALLSNGEPRKALDHLDRAIGLKPDYAVAIYNRGNALRQLGRFEEALSSYDEVSRLKGDDAPTLNNRGLVLIELGRLEDGVDALQRAVERDAQFAEAQRNLGAALLKLGRPEEAIARYDRILQSAPKDADAWCGRGNALLALERREDALSSYTQALRADPTHIDSLINRGHLLQSMQGPAAALEDYAEALRLAPDAVLALNNSGNALLELGQPDAALVRYDRVLQLSPEAADTWYNRGAALRDLRRYEESAQSFAAVLRIDPTRDYALENLFHVRLDCCDWTDYESAARQLRESLAQNKRLVNPLSLLLLPDMPAELPLHATQAYVAAERPENFALGPCATRTGGLRRKIRVAYVSADFREHPVSHLLVGTLEKHDRAAFEVIGVSLEHSDASPLGQRVRAAFDQFVEVKDRSDQEVAQLLRALDVDIAIDLMGLTQGMRLGVFAHRAAPVQAGFLGFACTVGAPYMDYLIADATVIPIAEEERYAERVVRLPHSFLPNDDQREIAAAPTREAAGLPADKRVLCAFTNTYKINPRIFDVWMRLMREEPETVLWLRASESTACANLQREAQVRGVAPRRLIFAPQVPRMADHLARQRLADLYLDTLPYNAHSTACDALWAGVPLLTCAGDTFAGRVAASALLGLDLPELITYSLEEYERRALELIRDPAQLQTLRTRLAQNRERAPLFDTARYTHHLEAAYRTMHECACRGEAPAGFDVADLAAHF